MRGKSDGKVPLLKACVSLSVGSGDATDVVVAAVPSWTRVWYSVTVASSVMICNSTEVCCGAFGASVVAGTGGEAVELEATIDFAPARSVAKVAVDTKVEDAEAGVGLEAGVGATTEELNECNVSIANNKLI